MCAVRPVKAAGAKPWIRPWGEKPGRARCTPKEQSVYEARRARDPAPRGAGRDTSLVDSDVLPPPLSN